MSDDVLEISVDGKTIYLNAKSFIHATWNHPAFKAYRDAAWQDGFEHGTATENDRAKANVEYYRKLTYGINNYVREHIQLKKEALANDVAKDLLRIEQRRKRIQAREALVERRKSGELDGSIKKVLAKNCCGAYEPWGEEHPDHVEKEEIEEYLAGVR